jgi:hypothetical protein
LSTVRAFLGRALRLLWCQYLHFCTSKASKGTVDEAFLGRALRLRCQYLHFCTSKASKLST